MKKVLIIGYGNTLRGDDGAGVRAAAMAAERHREADWVSLQELHPEIAEVMTNYESVIIVDAALDVEDVVTTQIRPSHLNGFENNHSYSPQALVNVCHALYHTAPSNTYLIRIPATTMDFSEQISSRTSEKIVETIAIIDGLLADH